MNKRYSIQTKTTFQFPPAPEGEEWHNPEGATAEEVGVGYRLLTKRERQMLGNDKLKLDNVSLFNESGYRVFSEESDKMSGISTYTYRVPDTTPISTSLVYNKTKFYGYADSMFGRKMFVEKSFGKFSLSSNPSSFAHESIGLDSFDEWLSYADRNRGEVKEFDSLREIVEWMAGGR